MKLYLVWKKTEFDGINMTGYQCDMFHGCENENKFRKEIYSYGDRLATQNHFDVNIYNLGEIIKPGRHLVVSEKIKKILESFNNIAFLQAIFDKIVNIPYEAGKLPDTCENLFTNQPISFLNIYEHDPSLTIGNYYELIAPEVYVIEENYHDTEKISFQYRETSLTFDLNLSELMLTENPIIWTSEGSIFRDFVFEKIASYFNWDFFEKKEYDITF